MKFKIRTMEPADLDRVVALENECFSSPWSRRIFLSELDKNNTRYVVAEPRGGRSRVAGYGGLWLLFSREAHLTNLAVDSRYRRQGLGRSIVKKLIEHARRQGAELMTLEVRESNDPARSLYRRLGFMACGVRPNYYRDTGEDAVIMWLVIPQKVSCSHKGGEDRRAGDTGTGELV